MKTFGVTISNMIDTLQIAAANSFSISRSQLRRKQSVASGARLEIDSWRKSFSATLTDLLEENSSGG